MGGLPGRWLLQRYRSDDDVVPPFISQYTHKLNMEAYIKCMENIVLSRTGTVTMERPYIWQQDLATCHTSRRSQSWLSGIFTHHITPIILPLNSSDCNLLDYYFGFLLRDQENYELYQRWTKGKDNGSIYQLKHEDHCKVL